MLCSGSDIASQLFILLLLTLFTAATGAMLWCNCFKLASAFMLLINHLSSFCLRALWERLRGALSTCLGELAPRQPGQMAPRVTSTPPPLHRPHPRTPVPPSQDGQRWEKKSLGAQNFFSRLHLRGM